MTSRVGNLVGGIDHAVLLVSDLDRAANQFETLGFTLSPRGRHSASMGTANHTIVFAEDYLELLSVLSATPGNVQMRERLAERGDNFMMVAGRTGDVHASRAALATLGIATDAVVEFSRPLPLPDGTAGTAAFSITTFAENALPEGKLFLCEHKTKDMVWRPELMTHANGACAMTAIIVITAAPEATAGAYSRLFAAGSVQTVPQGFSVATGQNSAQIHCMTLAAALERYPGITEGQLLRGAFGGLQIAVTDLKATQAHLKTNRIDFEKRSDGNGIFVSPADAGGALLEFIAR